MKAHEIASKASHLVGGDREKTHGSKLDNHTKIADVWNGILACAGKRVTLSAHDVCNLMEGLKIARRYSGSFNIDDYIDGAGYAACAGEIAAEMERAHKSWADVANNKTAA
jgi:hypothetical protein